MPPGGHLTLWAGWSGGAACWWCIMKSCRGLCSHSSVSSRHSWTSLRPRRGCSVLTATRTGISNVQGPNALPLTHSLVPWGRWLTPSLIPWTRHCRAGTLADFHRSTSLDDGLKLIHTLTDCSSKTLWNGDSEMETYITWLTGKPDALWGAVGTTLELNEWSTTIQCESGNGAERLRQGQAVTEPNIAKDLTWFVALHYWDYLTFLVLNSRMGLCWMKRIFCGFLFALVYIYCVVSIQ